MDIEKLFKTADFARNPAHREKLRSTLFGKGGVTAVERLARRLSDADLERVAAAGTGSPLDAPGVDWREKKKF